MSDLLEDLFGVTWHWVVKIAFFVVPIQRAPTVQVALTVFGGLVLLLQGLEKMPNMFLPYILYIEVVHH